MNPVFTLNYPEFLVVDYLQKHFKTNQDYSVLIPPSAQQKGYDVVLMRRQATGSKIVTFQVKSSKAHAGTPGISPRTGMNTFAHYMWLSRFTVPPEADFFILLGLYAPNPTSLKNTTNVRKSHMLLFSHQDMTRFMAAVRQRKVNKPDTHFGFGFNSSHLPRALPPSASPATAFRHARSRRWHRQCLS